MTETLDRFLEARVPVAEEIETWGDLPLRVTAYLSSDEPPLTYVTSVRALVFGNESVLVIWDDRDGPQLLPGGRVEPGETLHQTLYREILEETGVEIYNPVPLGFLHFHHLGQRPADYAYPFPDFLQAVYLASAGEERSELRVYDAYVTRSAFVPIADASALPLRGRDRAYLTAAQAPRLELD